MSENTIDYDASFLHQREVSFKVAKRDILEREWDAWAIIFEDKNGESLYREDAYKEEIDRIKEGSKGDHFEIHRKFYAASYPSTVVVWPYSNDTDIGWGKGLDICLEKKDYLPINNPEDEYLSDEEIEKILEEEAKLIHQPEENPVPISLSYSRYGLIIFFIIEVLIFSDSSKIINSLIQLIK